MAPRGPIDRTALERRQRASLGWQPPPRLSTPREAERFLERVGIALRYQATPGLPLASLRSAVGPIANPRALTTSIGLTNHLLATAAGIEVTVVAARPALIDHTLAPALFTLVRRGHAPEDRSRLSLRARAAAALIDERREVSAGDVRRHLGAAASPRHDPGYEALAELQRHMLVDRGPFE